MAVRLFYAAFLAAACGSSGMGSALSQDSAKGGGGGASQSGGASPSATAGTVSMTNNGGVAGGSEIAGGLGSDPSGRAGAGGRSTGSGGTGTSGAGGAPSGLSPASLLPNGGPSSLVFNDEFNAAPTLSTYAFYPCWGDQNNPQEDPAFLQGETQTAGLSGLTDTVNSVAGGKLVITGSKTSTRYGGQTFPYRSGRVRTKQSWLYGYFEARIKPAAGQGMWTTLWLMPPAYKDSAAWEIDIAEFPGTGATRAYQNLHWGLFSDGNQSLSNVDADYSTAMHTYGVHWEASRIRWFIDGTLVKTYTGPNVPNVALQLTYSLDMGGPAGWVGNFDGSTPLPRGSEIDFIRVYQ